MGKNYSCNNTGKRNKNDFYQTPYSITQQLIETGELDNCETFLEPACGKGAISKIIVNSHFDNNKKILIEYDLYNGMLATGLSKGIDFLDEKKRYDCVITNPPFSRAHEFILHAKKIANKKIIFLMPLSYLHGIKRYNEIWCDTDFRLKCVYIFTRYPLLENTIREDGKYNTGMQVYAWYVWDIDWRDEPVIRWIDNNEFVLKKGE